MSIIFTTINTQHDPINNIGTIRNIFDNVVDKQIYTNANTYVNMYMKFKEIFNKNCTYVNISTDRAISSSTISALNETYMYNAGNTYKSNLKILYIDSIMDMNLNNYNENENDKLSNYEYRKSVVSNLLTLSADEDITRTYTNHKLPLSIDQFIFLCQNNVDDYEKNMLIESNIMYYPYTAFKKNPVYILDKIIKEICNNPVAIIFDMSVFNVNIAPCTIRESYKDGIDLDQLHMILDKLSKMNKEYNNVKMIDITGHYLSVADTEASFRITIETITKIYSKICNMKEYAINIYNENTRFMIYKPVDELCLENQFDCNDDNDSKVVDIDYIGDNYGWYMLRNVPNNIKDDLMREIDNDTIKIISINDGDNEIDIMVSSTTMSEQNEKCYYTATSYKDCTLYPDEKMAMMFELVNG